MTRLYQTGAELGHIHAEGISTSGTTITFDTGTKRSGVASFKCDSSAAAQLFAAFSGTLGRGYYAVCHFLIPAASGLPGSNARILTFNPTASQYSARLTTTGKIQLLVNASTQVGSDSVATITTDTWYRLELFQNIGSGSSDDSAELRLDGVTVASETNQTRSTTALTGLTWGWVDDPGTSEVIFHDDIAVNDNQGSVNNTWTGDQKVYALRPTADSAVNNWKDGNGGATNIFGSVDNTPPIGEATTGTTVASQIENATSAAGNAYDATMTTYTAAGVGSSDLVTAVHTVVEIGSSSVTGSDTLTHSVVSNPAVAGVSSSCDVTAGAYPTTWNRHIGTISENPSVTNGTAPVMRVSKDVATTRNNACCLMAISVATLPNGAATATRLRNVMMVG